MKLKQILITLLVLTSTACSQYKPPAPAALLDSNGAPVTNGNAGSNSGGPSSGNGGVSEPTPLPSGDGYTAQVLGDAAKKLFMLLAIESKTSGNQMIKSGKAYECSFTETEKPEVQYRCDFILNPKTGASAAPQNTGIAGKAEESITADEFVGPLALTTKDQSGNLLLGAKDSQALYQSLDFKPVELAATADFNIGYVKNAKNVECMQSNPKTGDTQYLCKIWMKPATGDTLLAPFYVP
jgi:hypothetical protein